MTLTATNLACIRAERLVFEGLNFTAPAGKLTAPRGPNGSGKSSLLRLIAGLVPVAEGRIDWLGEDVTSDAEPLRNAVHYCGHLDAVKPALTTEENLFAWAGILGTPTPGKTARIDAALEAFGLFELGLTPAQYLSAGQKKRLSLARLLLADRPLWLLDEPTVGLDIVSVDLLAGVMRTHLATGGVILAATHIDLGLPSETLQIADAGQAAA